MIIYKYALINVEDWFEMRKKKFGERVLLVYEIYY